MAVIYELSSEPTPLLAPVALADAGTGFRWPVDPAAPLSYAQALAYLFHSGREGSRLPKYGQPERSQARMRELLARMGDPQLRFSAVHIAGTKGKGSTSAFCESMLRSLGLRTGLFTSPHLHTFRERMRVDGALIGGAQLAELMGRLRPIFESIPDLTVFDRITALALQHFCDQGVEWAVLEVGLGGRLDSTNVVEPAVCGITSISLDHLHVLGETLAQIAWEKAGILKPGVPAFTVAQPETALAQLQAVAAARSVSLALVPPYEGPASRLQGQHQRLNAGLAYALIENLGQRGLLRWDAVGAAQGIQAVIWPGRFELLSAPGAEAAGICGLLVDCAHNGESVQRLVETLAQVYPQRPVTFIVGTGQDKQIQPILEQLLAYAPRLVLVRSRHPRAAEPTLLWERAAAVPAGSFGPPQLQIAATMGAAIDLAGALTPPGGLLVGTGSVFVAAELREAWAQRYGDCFARHDWVFEAVHEPPY